ncbi:MAG: hypothetical protein IPJ65_38120 [Archangiaceae bacterium]|nr:hypothetical protein [Archangiaceae bacterium]
MPNSSLYGSDPSGAGGLYGRAAPLSTRNAEQASQLGLPEAVGDGRGAAGSQIEANDPFANFEDIFNTNRGKAQEMGNKAVDKVNQTAGAQSSIPKDGPDDTFGYSVPETHDTPVAKAGRRPEASPAAPPAVAAIQQAPDLNSKQAAADNNHGALLGQYGQEEAPPPQSGGLSVVGGTGGTTTLGGGQGAPVIQQSADSMHTKGAKGGPPKALTPPAAPDSRDDVNSPDFDPFRIGAPQPNAGGDGTVKVPDHDPRDTNLDGYVSQIEQDQAEERAPKGKAPRTAPDFAPRKFDVPDVNPTTDELGQLDRLTKTNDMLKGYADDGGQDILKSIYGDATGWDAAVMNVGGGKAAFGDLQTKYGGKDEEYKNKLIGDITERRRQAAAANQANDTNAANYQWNKDHPAQAPAGPDAPWHPEGYTDLRSFMDSGEAGEYAHEVAMDISPVDWLTRAMGEAGYDGENTSQLFAEKFGANGNQAGGTGDFNTGNLRSAARLVQSQLGDKALNYWYQHLTPEMWQSYMNLGNAGAMAREMRAWLSSLPPDVKKQLGI